jgi:hypothetical protein
LRQPQLIAAQALMPGIEQIEHTDPADAAAAAAR